MQLHEIGKQTHPLPQVFDRLVFISINLLIRRRKGDHDRLPISLLSPFRLMRLLPDTMCALSRILIPALVVVHLQHVTVKANKSYQWISGDWAATPST